MKKLNSIFVIEDSKILLEIISLQLKQKFNCNVVAFENGEEVIQQIKKIKPDMIVLDYNFSGEELCYTNGLQLLKEIRKFTKTPVIVFSGQVKKEIALSLIRNGANDYISKDNDDFMDELITAISNIVELQKAKKMMSFFKSKLNKNLLLCVLLLLLGLTIVAFARF